MKQETYKVERAVDLVKLGAEDGGEKVGHIDKRILDVADIKVGVKGVVIVDELETDNYRWSFEKHPSLTPHQYERVRLSHVVCGLRNFGGLYLELSI